MKKTTLILAIAVCLTLFLFALAGCNEDTVGLATVEMSKQPEVARYEVGSFCYEDFEIKATNSDGTFKYFTLSPEYLSDYGHLQINQIGVHTVTVNFRGLTTSFTVEIVERTVGNGATPPYMESKTFTYDGAPHSLTVEGDLPADAVVRFESGPTFTNSGSYNVVAVITAENYETIRLTATMVIEKADYDLSGLVFAPNYGKDNEGNAKTSFVYDGEEHSVELLGTIPEGLTMTYQIGTRENDPKTFKEGNSATDAGVYYVRAVFAGEEMNHTRNGLTLQTTLVISKKPTSLAFLEGLELGTKTVTYDGQGHRLYFESLELPDGIRVEYLDENGNLFGSRVEANTEGYLVYPHFINDSDPNSEIVTDIVGKLIINPATLAGSGDVTVTFEDGNTEVDYDNTKHFFTVGNLPALLSVDRFEVDGELADGAVNAGTYTVTLYFGDVGNNYLPVPPLETTLKIAPIVYIPVQDSFPGDVSFAYNPEFPLTLNYVVFSMPIGMTASLSYIDGSGVEKEGMPEDITEAGVYTCRLEYSFIPTNYLGIPETFTAVRESKVSIIPRVYDAESAVETPNSVYTYNGSTDWATKLYPTGNIPNWATFIGTVLQNANGEIVTEAINAGDYSYRFQFEYYNGAETVTALSGAGNLKVVGMPVEESYFTLHYESNSVYDGTAHLPTVTFNFPEGNDGHPAYEIASYHYDRFDNTGRDVPSAEYEETSKLAGKHTFSVKIYADNYEPYYFNFSLLVERKTISVDHDNFTVTSKFSCVYDGEDHSIQIFKTGTDSDLAYVTFTVTDRFPQDNVGKTIGVDVGVYYFDVAFSVTDSNYVLDVDGSFSYQVEITAPSP